MKPPRGLARAATWALAFVLCAAAAHQTWRLVTAWRYNQAFAAPGVAAPVVLDAPASTLFVRGHAAAAQERMQDALTLYQAAAREPAYAVAAQYNLGNLHLREALALQSRGELQNNPQPAELAKRHYRAALRVAPAHWPSKYNLERVLHLAPEGGDETIAPGYAADRAVTSLRGFTLGLP